MTVLTDADQISEIAFGFMGSKALFAALGAGVFTHLADGPMSCAELARHCPLDENRTETLMTALAGLGLVEGENGAFRNSPAAESFLVKGAIASSRRSWRLATDSPRRACSSLGMMPQAITPPRSRKVFTSVG